jgi:hypothetical protein
LRQKLTLRLRCAEIKLKKRDLGFLGIPRKQRLDILANVPRKLKVLTGIWTFYADRDQTRREHLAELQDYRSNLTRLGWRLSNAQPVSDCYPSLAQLNKNSVAPPDGVGLTHTTHGPLKRSAVESTPASVQHRSRSVRVAWAGKKFCENSLSCNQPWRRTSQLHEPRVAMALGASVSVIRLSQPETPGALLRSG